MFHGYLLTHAVRWIHLFKIDTSSQNFAPFLFAQAFHQEAGEQEVGSAGNLYLCTVYKITEQLSGGSNT